MSYEFQCNLYSTKREMLSAIASAWLTGDGANTADDIRECFAAMTDDEIAAEVIDGWDLDREEDGFGVVTSHMDSEEYTKEDLAAVFEAIRARLDDFLEEVSSPAPSS